jgi:mono/diheme cytochrome c family protein
MARPAARIVLVVAAFLLSGCGLFIRQLVEAALDPFLPVYDEKCSVCHGENLEGTALGSALVGRDLAHGGSVAEIAQSISAGVVRSGMPAWSGHRREKLRSRHVR